MADKLPAGCAQLWNKPCGARECLYPYCRERDFNRAEARAKIAEEKAAVLASMKKSQGPKCALCQDRGYYLANFADNHFTPCRCPQSIGGARVVA